MGVGAAEFNIGSPQKAPRERAPYDPKWTLDNKFGSQPIFQFDPKDAAAWLKRMRNNFIGQQPDIEILLDWVENQQHKEIKQTDVKSCGLALDADPVQVSQRIWSWLQIPLLDSGTPELDSNNAEPLNGLEVWRRLAVPTASRSLARRYALREKVNNPKQCGTFLAVEQLKLWKKDLSAYIAVC